MRPAFARVLVTAIGSMAAREVVRALRSSGHLFLVGANSAPPEPLMRASFDEYIDLPRADDASAYLAAVETMCHEFAIDFVLPLTDLEIDAFASLSEERRAALPAVACPMPRAAMLARDKWRIACELAGLEGISTIPTWLAGEFPAEESRFPVVVKPRRGRSSEGLSIARDAGELRLRLQGDSDCIVQELQPGCVHVVDVLLDAHACQGIAVVRREIERTPNGAGLVVEVFDRHPLGAAGLRAAQAIGLTGCCNLEFIGEDDRFKLMDVNPRPSAGIGFSRTAGYDFVQNLARAAAGRAIESLPVSGLRAGRYRWNDMEHGHEPG